MECLEKAEESFLQGTGDYIWMGIYQVTAAKRAMTSPLVNVEQHKRSTT